MTTPNYVQRLRVKFSKEGAARWIGHLDLARTWERALNRAQIPMAYTQGFNRRPRMQFANALPLGYTSSAEYVDLWLGETMTPEQAKSKLMERMAPGIAISTVEEVAISQPKLPALTKSAHFQVELAHVEQETADLAERVRVFNESAEIIRQKRGGKNKGREYNLRPLVLSLVIDETAEIPTLLMELAAKEGGQMGRPSEVLGALGYDPLNTRAHRTAIMLDETLLAPPKEA